MSNSDLEKIIQKAKEVYGAGDYPAAIQGFQEARKACIAAGDELLSAEMANNLSVVYLQNKQPQMALEAALGTDLVFEAHKDISRQGIALGNIGSALEELGELDKAVEYYNQSIELLEQAGEKEYRGLVQKSLATIKIRQGKHLEGIVSMQQSFEGQKKLTPKERLLKRLLKLPFKFLGK
jgi:tetratricopeptide (TPR) repeat protein